MHNIKLAVVNIGGGFPVPYSQAVPSLKDIATELEQACKRLPYAVELWCEPGRYLVAEAGTIHAHVIGITRRRQEPWLFLDTGRFQSFIEMFESEDIRYPVSYSGKNHKLQAYTLTGPTCDSYDTIMHDVILPEDITVGDRLSFGMCGAYTHVYGAPFNDFPLPQIVYS
jgi:ornithine decarboxylase